MGLVYVVLCALSLLFVLPFVWLVMTSFKPESEIFTRIVPSRWTGENYQKGLSHFPFWLYLRNTLFLCVVNVVGTVLSSSLVAYGLSRIPWKGRDLLFGLLLSTMMLPAQVTMVPLFAVFKWLGWIDTFLPLTVPSFLGSAFFIFLLRQFFLTIPGDLTDAARLDGCSEFDIYRRVVMPLARPALATVALFTFMNTWNDYIGPLIYLYDTERLTLSLGLATFRSQYGSYWGQMMAVSTLMIVPILVLFFFTQRTFIQGMTMSGLKG
jgi:multiple sugar transport system permease protein